MVNQTEPNMSNNRQDEKQLSLDFERGQFDQCVHRAVTLQAASSTVRSHLELVVSNPRVDTPLSPNSSEITSILAMQAKSLSW
jgi:hypothetical protein